MIKANGMLFGGNHFPNKEVIYRNIKSIENTNSDIIVEFTFENNADIADLVFLNHYIEDYRDPTQKKILVMKYIPYSAMDREIPEDNQLCSLDYFAYIINDLHFDEVRVLDPHSERSKVMIDNLVELDINTYVNKAIDLYNPDIIFFPDAGANTKYKVKLKEILKDRQIISGAKRRDVGNRGKLMSLDVDTCGIDITNKRILIVDDICRYGGTFRLSAAKLKELGASDIGLYVTHCENTVFEGKLLDNNDISVIYTTDSIARNKEHSKIVLV